MTRTSRAMQTYRQYLAERARQLRADYPESTAEERRYVLLAARSEWLDTVRCLDRDAIVPMDVARSLIAIVGRAEASRTLRHVSNFPACMPLPSQEVAP